MSVQVYEILLDRLGDYAQVPIRFEVKTVFRVEPVQDGLGGMQFHEVPVEPYIKDYYDCEDGSPIHWAEAFDIRNWGFFLAVDLERPVGATAVAWNTNGVDMLEGRRDLSVLWDIRVAPEFRNRGIGKKLIENAARWSRERGVTRMKIETQNVNVTACRFYQRMGCTLGDIRRFGYAGQPHVAHEVQLNWYLQL